MLGESQPMIGQQFSQQGVPWKKGKFLVFPQERSST
jgi:hypothetical protein